ncbi:MAG: serine/threonine-protein kinase [Wenzhouxiangellaceae bacterium]|nr:serine/threonine-protein kinase [Wenzhouxiangellaceae bacterium]
MSLDVATWTRVTELFEQLVELPPVQREQVLESSRPEPVVREWLDKLLCAHESSDECLIDHTVLGVVGELESSTNAAADHETRRPALPERIGPWRLAGEIARGGMGIVVRAERDDGQYQQQVAIKLLRARSLDAAEQRMLQQELRLLARLEHPGIARLIDGGVSEEGLPYIVMEYVAGEPIDEWCNRHGVDLDQRIALVEQVCEALAHAHRRLVVHADIKPANVLVDEQGRVRLVDFGIAGLLAESDSAAVRTELRCSPAWCAPEQLAGESPDASQDIFATGALLRRLLTGRRMRSGQAITCWLAGQSGDYQPPAPPSTEALDILAPQRLRGDLDAICLRALQADPQQRYVSMNALRADLERWRQGHMVSARPLSPIGRCGRFLRRHPLPVAASTVAVLALVVGFTSATINARQARLAATQAQTEAMRADAVRDFVLDLFRAADPLRQGGAELSTREVLAGAVETLDANAKLPPEVRVQILNLLSDVQRSLGGYDDAEELLARAENVLTKTPDLPVLLRAETRFQQALLAEKLSDRERARESLTEAARLLADPNERSAVELRARIEIELALNASRSSEPERAETHFDTAQHLLATLQPPELDIEKLLHGNRGVAAYRAGDYERALDEMRQTLAIQQQLGNAEQGAIVTTLSNLAAIEAQLGRLDEALDYDRRALAIARQAFPEGHMLIGRRLYSLGDTLRQRGEFDAALEALAEARRIQQAADLPAQVELIDLTRARTLLAMGRFDEAADLAAETGQAMAAREGPLAGEVLLLLDFELAALHALDDPLLAERLMLAEQRLASAIEAERVGGHGRRLALTLAAIALDRGDPARAGRWLALHGDRSAFEAGDVPLIALSLELRRRVYINEPAATTGLAERLQHALNESTLTAETRAHAWCALAEVAAAGNQGRRLAVALDELEQLAASETTDAPSRRMIERMRAALDETGTS